LENEETFSQNFPIAFPLDVVSQNQSTNLNYWWKWDYHYGLEFVKIHFLWLKRNPASSGAHEHPTPKTSSLLTRQELALERTFAKAPIFMHHLPKMAPPLCVIVFHHSVNFLITGTTYSSS
jgi:hypothetical protein